MVIGRGRKMPMYEAATKVENSRRIVRTMAEMGGIASFSQIEKTSGVEGSVLVYHLNRLTDLNVVEREVRGTYRLTYKTPFCYIYGGKGVPTAYLGLLGRRGSRPQPETAVALELLGKEGVKPDFVYVVTSMTALNEWGDLRLPYQWILCYEEEIVDIDAIKEKVTPQLESLLREYIVLLDCTSATKPATIAYYELAQTYYAPLIYIYEETRQLKWLISKEKIKEKLKMTS